VSTIPAVNQDDEHLRLLSLFHYVVAGMQTLFALFPLLHLILGAAMVFFPDKTGDAKNGDPKLVGMIFIGFATVWIILGLSVAACTVIAGRSLAQRRRYVFCVVVAAIEAATCMPFGTVLGIFTIIVLQRPSVKRAFGQSGIAQPTG